MLIYEAGFSVAEKIRGRMPSYSTFVCVNQEFNDETIEKNFENMVNYLLSIGLIIKHKDYSKLLVVTNNNDEYTLATEKIYTNNKVTYKTSNIVRHIFSELFTVNQLYIDENKSFVDLTNNGIATVNDRYLCITDTSKNNYIQHLYTTDENIFIFIINKMVLDNYYVSSYLEDLLQNIVPSFNITNISFIEKLFEHSYTRTMDIFKGYSALRKFMFDVNKLKLKPTIN